MSPSRDHGAARTPNRRGLSARRLGHVRSARPLRSRRPRTPYQGTGTWCPEATGHPAFLWGPAWAMTQARRLMVIAAAAGDHLRKLAAAEGGTAMLGVLGGNRVLCLVTAHDDGDTRPGAAGGDHLPLHATALGKALASQLHPGHIRAMLARDGMPAFTARTTTCPHRYLVETAVVRATGMAEEHGEHRDGRRSVAIPLRLGSVPAAVGLSVSEAYAGARDTGHLALAAAVAATGVIADLRGRPSRA